MRDVPLTAAGEGLKLCLLNADIRTLFKAYGTNYVRDITHGLLDQDIGAIDRCLAAALKKDGQPHPLTIDELDLPIGEVADRLLDAFTLAIFGKNYPDYLAAVVAEAQAANVPGSVAARSEAILAL